MGDNGEPNWPTTTLALIDGNLCGKHTMMGEGLVTKEHSSMELQHSKDHVPKIISFSFGDRNNNTSLELTCVIKMC